MVKLGGKSVTKLVSKGVKGAGFFGGIFLLSFMEFISALSILLAMNLIVVPFGFLTIYIPAKSIQILLKFIWKMLFWNLILLYLYYIITIEIYIILKLNDYIL